MARAGLGWTLGGILTTLCAGLPVTGCSDGTANMADAVTYHQHTAALFDRHCTTCHRDGGIAPFALTSYDDVQRYAPQIRSAVADGRMPPWMPADDSAPLRFSRRVPADQRDLFLRWADGGAQAGDPTQPSLVTVTPAETVVPARPDLTLDPGTNYAPNRAATDDYHCFVFDPKLTADTFLLASDVKPGNERIVHHVLAFEVAAADVPAIQAKNVGGAGYTCFGGPGTAKNSRPVTLLGWVPGSPGMRMPEGTAMRLHAGSLIVMQVHYNTASVPADQTDRTRITVELSSQPPTREVRAIPLAQPSALNIKAGDPAAKQAVLAPMSILASMLGLPGSNYVLYGTSMHMHLLGKSTSMLVSGKPLVNIPRWDFHWQQGYQLITPMNLTGSDVLILQCEWDNSAANQPVIGGQKQVPRDVTWGEGTLDEMCLSFSLIGPQ